MSLDLAVLPGFLAVILVFLIPLGPDMAYMIAVGLANGRRAAISAILGIGTGMTVYAAAVVLGLGRLAQTQPRLLDAIKIAGATYLLWLAFTTLRGARDSSSGHTTVASGRSYLRGLTVSLCNPKLIIFFVAVLPQFLGDAQNSTAQLAMLGAVNVTTEVLLYGSIGVLAGTFNSKFSSNRSSGVVLNYIAGVVYLLLAVVVLFELFI